MTYIIAALYKFAAITDPCLLRDTLHELCKTQGIKGTLVLANEGINGTVAGSREAITALYYALANDGRFVGMEYKESAAAIMPFHRLKVRVKPEIVTLGCKEADPTKQVGTYVEPHAWDELLADENVVVIDTRNQYEVEIGTFPSSISPHTQHFREFPKFIEENANLLKGKKVAMFCTGGIRCEKASSYMLAHGYPEVFHLKGGILKYLEETPAEKSTWQGECFIFDQRVAVAHAVEQGSFAMCYGCRNPLAAADMESALYEEGVTCPRCYHSLTEKQKASARERQKQVKLAAARNESHIGVRGKLAANDFA